MCQIIEQQMAESDILGPDKLRPSGRVILCPAARTAGNNGRDVRDRGSLPASLMWYLIINLGKATPTGAYMVQQHGGRFISMALRRQPSFHCEIQDRLPHLH